MPDNNDKELFDALDRKHPDYEAWSPEWERYRDVIGDHLVDESVYLPQGKFEPDNEYEFRMKLSQFIPESHLAISRLLGALYNEKPKRELKGQAGKLAPFLDDSDRKGNTWNAFIEMVAFNLLGYGTTRVLLNVPQIEIPSVPGRKDDDLSLAEERALGLKPFAINYSPLSVTDWEHDAAGTLIFVRIKEERTVRGKITDKKSHKKAWRFIDYTRAEIEWWDFSEGENNAIVLDDHEVKTHDLGMVPMVVESLRDVKPFIGQSFIRYSSKADIRKNQGESDEAFDSFLHCHPLLVAWTEDTMKEVGVGSNTFIKLDPGQGGSNREDLKYVEAPASALGIIRAVIEASRAQIDRQAQIDPMGALQSGGSGGFQASGAARAWSFGTSEARILSKIADRMEVVEARILDLVLRYLGEKVPEGDNGVTKIFKGDIQYPEEFDMASTAQLLEETAAIATMINSPKLLKTLHKRIAASKIGDTTAKALKEIQDEIEKNPLIGTPVGQPAGQDPFSMPGGAPGGEPPPGNAPPGSTPPEGEEKAEEGEEKKVEKKPAKK